MGVRFPSVQSTTILTSTLVTTTESVIVTTPPLTLPLDSAVVLLGFSANILGGTGVTGLSFNIRRGTLVSSTLVNAQGATFMSAGNAFEIGGMYFDTPGPAAGVQYSISVGQQSATANGTVRDVCLIAFAF